MSIEEEIYNKLVEQFGISDTCVKKYGKRPRTSWLEFIVAALKFDSNESSKLYSSCHLLNKDNASKYFTTHYKDLMKSKGGRQWRTWLLSLLDSKYCNSCSTIKAYTEFNKSKKELDGLNCACRACEKQSYQVNRELVLLKCKEYYILNRAAILIRVNNYRLANSEIISSRKSAYYYKNKEAISIKQRYYTLLHPLETRAAKAKYRASKLKATPQWADLEKIKNIYRECPKGYHVDHIVPLRHHLVCGLHCEFNLQHLTAIENMRKSNKFEV